MIGGRIDTRVKIPAKDVVGHLPYILNTKKVAANDELVLFKEAEDDSTSKLQRAASLKRKVSLELGSSSSSKRGAL